MPGARAVAAASRSIERGRLRDEHGLERAYGSYADIIAAGHRRALHRHASPAAPRDRRGGAQAGKAVLVEKTFTATVAGAEDIVAAARQHRVFAMEAMWTRFQPAIVAARALIDDGAIGEVRQVQADLGVDRPYDESTGSSTPSRAAARCSTSGSTWSRSRSTSSARPTGSR